MSNPADASFFVNLPSNVSQHTFPNNTASSFITKIDPVRQLEGRWAVAVVSMSHPTVINNIVGAYFDVRLIYYHRTPDYYTQQWQRVNIPDGYYTDVIELYAAMMKAMESQHPRHSYGAPFTFDINSDVLVVDGLWAVTFSPNLLDIFGISRHLRHHLRQNLNVPKTTPLFVHGKFTTTRLRKLAFTNLDTLHVNASIVKIQQVFGDKLLPLLRLVMYTDDFGKESGSVYHEFRRLDYTPVSASTLDVIKIDVTDNHGDSIKFQSGKVVLTLHFKKVS